MKQVILVVEDDRYVRENTTEMLELNGYNTLWAENGTMGFEIALFKKPDMILCDITMPETNGLELLEMLKSNEATRGIPLICFSENSTPIDMKDGKVNRANDYLRKPFTHEELMGSIHQFLNESSPDF